MNDMNSFIESFLMESDISFALRRATKRNDRQMRVPVEVFDLDVESSTGHSRNEHLGFGTRGRTRPVRPWLDSRSTMGREPTEVDFVGCLAAERRVGTMLVGPIDQPVHLLEHGVTSCVEQQSVVMRL